MDPVAPSNRLRKTLKIVIIAVAGVFAIVALLLVIWPDALRLSYGPWNKTFATLGHGKTLEAVVHGSTDSPLSGWDAELLWKKTDDRWYVYYLNHEAYFEKYDVKKAEQAIEVFCNGSLIGQLDTITAKFHHVKQNLVYDKPLNVIHGSNLEDREKWQSWDRAEW
jgi:hypothetical protein